MLDGIFGKRAFEVSNLQRLNTRTEIRLVQLIDADDVNADASMSVVVPSRQPSGFVVAGDGRHFPAGASPTRQLLHSEATGDVVET